jgi:F0F1-type ATP synthase membrane subunit c/vacuolar-type H+-ATPase subunit K
MDAIARQPEARKIQTAMLIAAAIEGIGFAALFCLIKNPRNNSCNGWL